MLKQPMPRLCAVQCSGRGFLPGREGAAPCEACILDLLLGCYGPPWAGRWVRCRSTYDIDRRYMGDWLVEFPGFKVILYREKHIVFHTHGCLEDFRPTIWHLANSSCRSFEADLPSDFFPSGKKLVHPQNLRLLQVLQGDSMVEDVEAPTRIW